MQQVVPAVGSRVLANFVELSGDLANASTATVGERGAGIVVTDKTVYVANQVFELIGGMMQAHLNVEPVRHFTNAMHWGDTLLLFLRRLMLDIGFGPLVETRGCARSAPMTACCRSATTSTACATTTSSTTRSRT